MGKFILSILLIISLPISGCSIISPLFNLPEEKTTSQIVIFQDLLKQGWEIRVMDNKVLLIKRTNNELLIEDVFNISN